MKKATGTPFESDYGFKSPSFSVDALGNIIANSISTTEPIGTDSGGGSNLTNYIITENDSNTAFQFSSVAGGNPSITLQRGTTYTFELQLVDLSFNLFLDDGTTSFANMVDEEGNVGAAANGKTTGLLQVTISATTPDILIYKNSDGTIQGNFNIINPIASFGSVTISNTTNATELGTGVLSVAGGASISKDLYLGGNLVMEGTGDVKFDSSTNLTLGAQNQVVIVIDGTKLGSISSEGSSVPIIDTRIDNTVIGGVTPSTASFTSAVVSEAPTTVNNVTNKNYVDQQDIALSIALGT